MEKLKNLLIKYKDIISYLFFGVCTTAVNVAAYHIFYKVIKVGNIPATVIAWALSVAFAFVTNKLYVFDSKVTGGQALLKEIISFLGCRIFTGVIDVAIMYVAVDRLSMNGTFWKLVSNVIVIVVNYVASKFFIFKPSDKQ